MTKARQSSGRESDESCRTSRPSSLTGVMAQLMPAAARRSWILSAYSLRCSTCWILTRRGLWRPPDVIGGHIDFRNGAKPQHNTRMSEGEHSDTIEQDG